MVRASITLPFRSVTQKGRGMAGEQATRTARECAHITWLFSRLNQLSSPKKQTYFDLESENLRICNKKSYYTFKLLQSSTNCCFVQYMLCKKIYYNKSLDLFKVQYSKIITLVPRTQERHDTLICSLSVAFCGKPAAHNVVIGPRDRLGEEFKENWGRTRA